MDSKQKTEYKKIKLNLFETNHQGYIRLLNEFDTKLEIRTNNAREQLKSETKFEPIIDELHELAINVRKNIQEFQRFSEPDAIQALGCLGKALDDPTPENMNQLNLLISNFNSFRADDEKHAGVVQQRKALAVGISTVVFYLATITAAIAVPLVIPMLLVIAASITLPVGYFYSKNLMRHGQRREEFAENHQAASTELGESMRKLKDALPKAEGNEPDDSTKLKKK